MQVNLHGKNIELTNPIKNYVLKRLTNLEKVLSGIENKGGAVIVNFEVGKSTNHHKGGDVYMADCLISIDGKEFYSKAEEEDVYIAIDAVKDNLFREISKNKDRTQTLFKRGATSVKKMLKGITKRNPFTGKY